MDKKKQHAEIGIRYCGGCNPAYDRTAAARRMQKLLPQHTFENACPGVPYRAVLVLQGCPTSCAPIEDLSVPRDHLVQVVRFSDLIPARDRLLKLLAKKKEEALSLEHEDVEKLLPHRPPMLFVDTVSRLVPGKEASADLYLDPAWDLFKGHFPDNPVFPGVLAQEAMAQTAGIMVLALNRYAGRLPLLREVTRARFLRKLLPGTRIQIKAVLEEEMPAFSAVLCRCQILSEGRICVEADLILSMQ